MGVNTGKQLGWSASLRQGDKGDLSGVLPQDEVARLDEESLLIQASNQTHFALLVGPVIQEKHLDMVERLFWSQSHFIFCYVYLGVAWASEGMFHFIDALEPF